MLLTHTPHTITIYRNTTTGTRFCAIAWMVEKPEKYLSHAANTYVSTGHYHWKCLKQGSSMTLARAPRLQCDSDKTISDSGITMSRFE